MICSRCTGAHHSMACPDLRDTLIACGVRPHSPPPPSGPPVTGRHRAVDNVLIATAP